MRSNPSWWCFAKQREQKTFSVCVQRPGAPRLYGLCVPASRRCCKKMPHTGWGGRGLKQQKLTYSQVWRPKSEIKVFAGRFLPRPLSLALGCRLPPCLHAVSPLHTHVPAVSLCSPVSSPSRTDCSRARAHDLFFSLSTNLKTPSPPLGTFSGWRLGLPHTKFVGTPHSPEHPTMPPPSPGSQGGCS